MKFPWFQNQKFKLSKNQVLSKPAILVFTLLFSVAGVKLLFFSHAATPPVMRPVVRSLKYEFSSDEILVKIRPDSVPKVKPFSNQTTDTGLSSFNKLNGRYGAKKFEPVVLPSHLSKSDEPVFQWYRVKLANKSKKKKVTLKDRAGRELYRVMSSYANDPDIEKVSPNYSVNITAIPNDKFYQQGELGNLKKIGLESAWNISKGSDNVIVADVDTGIALNHPDLAANIWSNSGEKGPTTNQGPAPNCTSRKLSLDKSCNDLDDDKNGYIDDYHGWDFVNNDNSPADDQGHGTHTAGIIGAVGNNGEGVVGVNWTVKIMPLKFLDSEGSGDIDDGIKALVYAADNGARVSNNSWGATESQYGPLSDAINYEHNKNMVVVAAAGNESADANSSIPASSKNVITVAASGGEDQIACFSNWGEKIDVAAPGGDSSDCGGNDSGILSTYLDGGYVSWAGTSMAAPHVAGLSALIIAKSPSATPEQVRQVIRTSATDLGTAGQDIKYGYGRINAAKALLTAPDKMITPNISSPLSSTKVLPGVINIIGSTDGPEFAKSQLDLLKYDDKGQASLFNTLKISTTPVTASQLGAFNTKNLTDGRYAIRLTVINKKGEKFRTEVSNLDAHNFNLAITSPVVKVSQGMNNIMGFVETLNDTTIKNYTLEWGVGSRPTTWSKTGITLQNSGTKAVKPADAYFQAGSKLASWDTSNLKDGQSYSLRLTGNTTNGMKASTTAHIEIDKDIASGWPKSLCTQVPGHVELSGGWIRECSDDYSVSVSALPLMADIDGDGNKDLIYYSSTTKQILAYHENGSIISGFPYTVKGYVDEIDGKVLRLSAEDLDNDGKAEIIFSTFKYSSWDFSHNTNQFTIYVLQGNGTLLKSWVPPVLFSPNSGDTNQTPAIADIDSDGKNDIVIIDRPSVAQTFSNGCSNDLGDNTSRLNAFKLDGSELAGFPVTFNHNLLPGKVFRTGDTCWDRFTNEFEDYYPPQVLGDVNGDSKPEIIWGIGNQLFVFDNKGRTLPGWPYTLSQDEQNNKQLVSLKPTVGDLDGDGQSEIIAATNSEDMFFREDKGQKPAIFKLYALKNNGMVVNGFPKTLPYTYSLYNDYVSPTDPVTTDLDKDGKDDILGNYSSSGLLKVFYGNGDNDDQFHKNLGRGFAAYNAVQPIIFGDAVGGTLQILNSDFYGPFTIIDSAGNKTWPLNSRTKDFLPVSIPPNGYITEYPRYSVASQMKSNNGFELANEAEFWKSDWQGYDNVSMYLWKIPSSSIKPTVEWPQYGHDSSLTSNTSKQVKIAPTKPSAPTLLSAKATTAPSTLLTWQAGTNNVKVASYYIVRNGQALALLSRNSSGVLPTSFTDSKVTAGTKYTYRVFALASVDNFSESSNQITLTIPIITDKQAPTWGPTGAGLVAKAVSTSQINMAWKNATDNIGVKSYRIFRNGTNLIATIPAVADTTFQSWGNTGLASGTTYSYTVKAVDASGNVSLVSNTAEATTLAPPPQPTIGVLSGTVSTANPTNPYSCPSQPQLVQVTTAPAKGSVKYICTQHVQWLLNLLDGAGLAVNGFFNTNACTAVTKFKVRYGLPSECIFGTGAWDAINNYGARTAPAAGAKVTFTTSNGNLHIFTADSNGKYDSGGILAGVFAANYSLQQYSPQSVSVSVTSGHTTTKNVTLTHP